MWALKTIFLLIVCMSVTARRIWDWLFLFVLSVCSAIWWEKKKDFLGIFFFFFSCIIIWHTLGMVPSKGVFLLLGMLGCLIFCFFSFNLIFFFIFFEIALVPLFFMILNYGSTPERMKASWGIILYTVGGSLPFLAKIVDYVGLSLSCGMYSNYANSQFGFFLFWVVIFFVKIPIFGFHSWLPVAHGEAPTYGSMILGAIILKLGVIGLFRVTQFLVPSTVCWGVSGVIAWVIFGFFLSTLLALSKSDLKIIIAFSSMVHLSPVVIALFLSSFESIFGSSLMGIGHGFVSSLLFLGMGNVYSSRGYRSSYFMVGVSEKFFLGCWFIGCVFNASLPPSLNFFSEMFLYYTFFVYTYLVGIFCIPSAVLSGIYCLNLYTSISHGGKSKNSFTVYKNLYFFWSMGGHLLFSVIFMFFCLMS